MKKRKIVAISVSQDYLVATKYALKVLGVYNDANEVLRWYTYDVLLRSDNYIKLKAEAFKVANKMNVPFLAGLKSTSTVSNKHITILQRRLLI